MTWTGAGGGVDIVSVLQRNRTDRIYGDIQERRFIMGIVSHDYGDQEAPWCAVCEVKAQESWWCNSVGIWRPHNKRSQCCKSCSKSESPRTRSTDDQGQLKEREQIHPLPDFLFSSPQWKGWCFHRQGESSFFFTQCADSTAAVFWNTLTDTSRNNILPAI